ncbi:MAG: hypothetical protein WCC71_23090 [Candidatus Sulfotelmatobacter sp.]
MKHLTYILFFVLVVASSARSQTRPRPPGLEQAEQAEQQADKSLPPPMTQRTHVDFTRLRQDADDLARIAQTIPDDITSIQKGMLPKDMVEKLKQIEKLSKRLRGQISQ